MGFSPPIWTTWTCLGHDVDRSEYTSAEFAITIELTEPPLLSSSSGRAMRVPYLSNLSSTSKL
jgi:hypothetical protein